MSRFFDSCRKNSFLYFSISKNFHVNNAFFLLCVVSICIMHTVLWRNLGTQHYTLHFLFKYKRCAVQPYLVICDRKYQMFSIFTHLFDSTPSRLTSAYTGCLKIREFRIQSVVGDHFSSSNMEIKKNRDSPHKDTLV
jgi:hypothetical protein